MTKDFEAFCRLLNRRSGLSIDAEKAYLVESRLQPLVQHFGFIDVDALIRKILTSGEPDLERDAIDAMTTNETFFFRDRFPFDNFARIMLPELLRARKDVRQLRIWCAACSTGQEPYSLAMILDEEASKLIGWDVEILATDLSRHVLALAREGVYSQFEMQRGLPITRLLRNFRQEGEQWQINEHLRSRVHFEEFNLLNDYRKLGVFDVIFCRNVVIYFDMATKRNVLDRMAQVIAPDGYFVMGATETTVGLTDMLVPHPEYRSTSVSRSALNARRPPLMLAAG